MQRKDGHASSCRGAARRVCRARVLRHAVSGLTSVIVLAGCVDDAPAPTESRPAFNTTAVDPLVTEVRALAVAEEIGPLASPPPVRLALIRLGQVLAFDKILSGNRDISCMTCHHPALNTGDERHLSIGQGATGLGKKRVHPQGVFIPRNSPPLYNLHAVTRLFWDGRVALENGEFVTPAGTQLTPEMKAVFEFGAPSALGLFPVISREEMRAFSGNELAAIPDGDFTGVWAALMARLGQIPEYRFLFELAYPGTNFRDMTFAHASNAIAGFFIGALGFNRSPWDRFLAGDNRALSATQLRGARSFMTVGKCSSCHGGAAFTASGFQNVALAQFGPGQGDGAGNDDFGRERVTGLATDRYRFRTTPLRNVELTAPYGHLGQFVKLDDFVDHYSESEAKLRNYNVSQLEPVLQGTLVPNVDAVLATRSGLLNDLVFTDSVTTELVAFLRSLTDVRARFVELLIPFRVPSGLPVDRVRF